MGGFFAVAARHNCASDLFFGTDYHSHLGTQRGGMAVRHADRISRAIHDITNAPFRTKFEADLPRFQGQLGIGVISDYDDQPVLVGSHLGTFAVITVGVIQNLKELVASAFRNGRHHFSEMGGGMYNPTEVMAAIISQEDLFPPGSKFLSVRNRR